MYSIILIAIVTLNCCQDDGSQTVPTASIGEPFKIKFNQTVKLKDSSENRIYELKFSDAKDERCPKSDCHLCYGSIAKVTIEVALENKKAKAIELQIPGCIDEISQEAAIYEKMDDLSFALLSLSPYPDKNSIEDHTYIATFIALKN